MDAKEFREKREILKWTQNQIAQEFRVHLRTIQNYENGKTEIPYTSEFCLNWLVNRYTGPGSDAMRDLGLLKPKYQRQRVKPFEVNEYIPKDKS